MTPTWATGDNCELPATATGWLADEPQPGLILVELVDAHGRPHQMVDKSVIFSSDLLLPSSTYPRSVSIRCTIEEINGDIATVCPWWTMSRAGLPFLFDVRLEVLVPWTENDE
ncbi:hypothetical protein [Nocardia sp. NPDC051981]|uniref:hypothetical protein n=1 Tax=Nocardia sp. NPDC051981 TaxID=3155417 RepID=UPI0034274A0F